MDMNAVSEELARFLCHRREFNAESGRVKPRAFLPPNGATSVFMVVGLAANEIWNMGQTHVARPPDRCIRGCAFIMMKDVRECGLELDPDNDPPRHANIVGWPPEKSERKLRAMDLSVRATLRLPGDGAIDSAT